MNFISKLLLLFGLLFAVDYSVGLIYGDISDLVLEKAPNASRTDYTMKRVNAEILIMGASRASHHYVSSLISDSLNKTVFNCGLDGQPFSYSVAMIYAVLQRYTPETIIVDIAPQMLASDFSFGNLTELYPHYSEAEFYKNLIIHEDSNHRYKMTSRMYRYNSKLIKVLRSFFLPDYIQENGYSALASKGYKYPHLHTVEYDTNLPVDNFKVNLLMSCIKLCKASDVNLMFVVSPRYQHSNIRQVSAYLTLKDILMKNNVPLIDLGENTMINDSTMYKDAAHLNHKGALEFTNFFLNRIKDME
ncbi:MAG: hypothetical protein RBQ97_11545 [Acholeplasma sp.]|nr:hypothetical protein [Acholeplasma sp.]